MTNANAALSLLSTGPHGNASNLLADRDQWYSAVSSMLNIEEPAAVAESADDAYRRTVLRSRLDDRFSSTKWRDEHDELALVSQDFEIRPGLWLTNLAGTGELRTEFRARARRIFPTSEFGPLTPFNFDTPEVAAIAEAVAILEEHFGPVWTQCASTISLIVLHKSRVVSLQSSYTPETVYIGDSMLNSPTWKIADAILHESLHERTLLERQLWRLLGAKYEESSAASVHLPWSGGETPDRYFTPWRLISAAHVYTHLAVFRTVIGEGTEVSVPATRGRFMLDALFRPEFASGLGVEGIELRDMLSSALGEVE